MYEEGFEPRHPNSRNWYEAACRWREEAQKEHERAEAHLLRAAEIDGRIRAHMHECPRAATIFRRWFGDPSD